jgi:DNA-binding CsgD family transcriptional regulator/tetratricopeptide (TPR) repeat protein
MQSDLLLERAVLLDDLEAHLRDAAAGDGMMVFVGGEAGIGKTALVRHFCSGVTRSTRVLLGACDAMSTPRPLGPLLDIASAMGGDLAGALHGTERREFILDLFLSGLRAAATPTVVVIEDAHWADDATLDLLRFLGRRLGGTHALVVVTYRDDELGPRHPLRILIGDLATSAAVRRLTLPPLTRAAVVQLAGDSGLDADELYRVTNGNPFFATEVLASGMGGVPATVRDAVMARMARLPDGAREALETASVIGREVDPGLLAALGIPVEAIEACLAAGMLKSSAAALTFRHELVRDAVYHALSAPRCRGLHRAVLAALEVLPAGRIDPAALAHHAAGAADAGAVLRLAPLAAHAAARLGAHKEAYAQYARALAHAHLLPDELHAELLEEYAVQCELVDELAESIRVRGSAAELWRALGQQARWGKNLALLADSHVRAGDNAAAEAAAARAVEVLEAIGKVPELAWAYRSQTFLRMLDRDASAAVEWGAKAIALATELGDAVHLAGAHLNVGSALLMAGDDGYREHFERTIALGIEHDIPDKVAGAYSNLGTGCGELHRFTEASDYLSKAIALTRDRDLDYIRYYALSWLALVRMYQGEWNEATSIALSVMNRPRVATISRIMALAALGRVRARRGDPEAWPALDEALELALGTGTLQRLGPVRAARAEAAWLARDPDAARSEAAAAWSLAARYRHPWFVGELGYWRWLAGDEAVLTNLPDYASEPFALQITGRAREAGDAWQRLGCPYEAARARGESKGEADQRAALEGFAVLGARPAAALVSRRLREAGARGIPRGPTAPTREHPAGLTTRERQVLELLAEGLRNVEIAQRHGVSVRTVDHQVSAILAKLGTRSRVEVIAEALQLGLLPPPGQDDALE